MSSSKSNSSSTLGIMAKSAVRFTEWLFMTAIPWVFKKLWEISVPVGKFFIERIEKNNKLSPNERTILTGLITFLAFVIFFTLLILFVNNFAKH